VSAVLIRLYPAAWRARYGDEFAALLEERPLGPLDVADILLGAFDAQLRLRGRDTGIARGKGFLMSLRIGGIAAVVGALLWAIAGVVNSGVIVDVGATLPSILLVAGMPASLVALAGLSAFQARTEPKLAWVAFLVPAAGTVACLVGLIGAFVAYDELFWLMFALGTAIAIGGSVLFAAVTYRIGTISRAGSALLGLGAILVVPTIANPGMQGLAGVALAAIALGWFALGVQAIRASGPLVAPRIA
jgi:hypothetical protein